jgi:hypothetical protein
MDKVRGLVLVDCRVVDNRQMRLYTHTQGEERERERERNMVVSY